MIEKLFESLDEKVFTPELKSSLEDSFNEAVEAKVEDKISQLDEKAEQYTEMLDERAEEFKEMLAEEALQEKEELLERVDMYLEKIVEEFTKEAQDKLTGTIVNEKADLMVEAMDAMLVAGGVEVAKIVEAKESSDVETKLDESIEKYDQLVEEVLKLEKENATLIKMGVIAEMKSDLSLVEADKFAELANLVEFTKDSKFKEKLDVIKKNVKGAVTESVNENINERVAESDYAHLI